MALLLFYADTRALGFTSFIAVTAVGRLALTSLISTYGILISSRSQVLQLHRQLGINHQLCLSNCRELQIQCIGTSSVLGYTYISMAWLKSLGYAILVLLICILCVNGRKNNRRKGKLVKLVSSSIAQTLPRLSYIYKHISSSSSLMYSAMGTLTYITGVSLTLQNSCYQYLLCYL